MQALWDFLAKNKDAIAAALAILAAAGGVLWAVLKFLAQRALNVQLKQSNNEVVDVITDPKDVLPKLLKSEKNDSELADHNIPYQQRNSEDTQGRLRSELNKKHYLLVTAPKGYGKTRETAMLAESLVRERYRIVRVLGKWLDAPDRLPDKLEGDSSRIIIFLDDLNGLFRSKVEQSPRAEKIPLLNEKSYHDRLLDVLDWYEKRCSKDEIRVIATARSDEAWEVLDFDEKDRLWARFTKVELNPPNINKVVEFLEREVKRLGIKSKEEDFEAIAHKNDGSFRNLILNLETIQSENKELNKDTFSPTEDGTWQENYERLLSEKPAIRYIYDAIDIARQSQIDLFPFIIESLAAILWGGNTLQTILRRRKVHDALGFITDRKKFLPKSEMELAPHDGQIEVRSHLVNWQNYAKELENLLLQLADGHREKTHGSLLGLGTKLYYAGMFKEAENCWRKILENSPANYGALLNIGVVLAEQERYREAEEAYRQAIAKDPNDAAAYSNLGNLLSDKKLERYAEAEEAYRQAIAKDPNYAAAYSNLGILLHEKLERYAEAEEAYRQAIAKDPNDAAAYNNLAILLRLMNRGRDALPLLEKLIEINPKDFNSYLGIASIKKTLGEAIEPSFIEKARQFMSEDDWYNRACLESVCDNFDLAFEHLQKAAQENEFDSKWAWEDPDLQWIRDDPRFTEIVGPKPEK